MPGQGPGKGGWVIGLASGDFGITSLNQGEEGFLDSGTPKLSLMQYQVQASANAGGGPGGGTDPSVIDQSSVFLGDVSDTLLSINAASAFGFNDTLIAANGADTLTAASAEDTLIGNAAGSTLIDNGGFGSGNVAAYTADNVVVDLNANTATVNGSSVSDTLVGIHAVEALGTNDTLIGNSGFQNTTLTALVGGNTLIAGGAFTTLFGLANGATLMAGSGDFGPETLYEANNLVVNLAAGTAAVNGSGISDTLVGLQLVTISGDNSTLVGGGEGDSLTAGGANNLVIAGGGDETLTTFGETNTLVGGSGTDVLRSSGFFNTLIAGSGVNFLSSTGFEDTLIGNGVGSDLLAAIGSQSVVAYTIDDVVVDLAADTATASGSAVGDTLHNFCNRQGARQPRCLPRRNGKHDLRRRRGQRYADRRKRHYHAAAGQRGRQYADRRTRPHHRDLCRQRCRR